MIKFIYLLNDKTDIMKIALDFLHNLVRNNNREWFDAHKDEYRAAQAEFDAFVQQLINGISHFDPLVASLRAKDCTYRIYRDVRFSKNKDPYKNHFGAYVVRGGKKSGYAGYYFHIEDPESNYIGSSILSSGIYCADPKAVSAVRAGIVNDSDEFVATLHKAKGFDLMTDNMLKRVPAGYASDSPMAEYLKHKDYSLCEKMSQELLLSDGLLDYTLGEFEKTAPFVAFINRQIEREKELF